MQETHNRRGRIVSRRIDRKKILLDSFFRAFGLIQKHQKIKHSEKQRVPPPTLAERAQKTPLFCTPAPGARAGAVSASAIFAVHSGSPQACQELGVAKGGKPAPRRKHRNLVSGCHTVFADRLRRKHPYPGILSGFLRRRTERIFNS